MKPIVLGFVNLWRSRINVLSSFAEFLHGGNALYVWSAFAITFIAMFAVFFGYIRMHRQARKDIEKKIQRELRLKDAKKMENTL